MYVCNKEKLSRRQTRTKCEREKGNNKEKRRGKRKITTTTIRGWKRAILGAGEKNKKTKEKEDKSISYTTLFPPIDLYNCSRCVRLSWISFKSMQTFGRKKRQKKKFHLRTHYRVIWARMI